MSIASIQNLQQHKNYVPPVGERQLGWRCYAEVLPVEVCGTDAMRRGWLAANRAQAEAETAAYMVEVQP